MLLSTLFTSAHFNSIKVQLEPYAQACSGEEDRFQFHKGTIRTGLLVMTNIFSLVFQFHKGTIRTLIHKLILTS